MNEPVSLNPMFSKVCYGGGSGEVRTIFPEERNAHNKNTLSEDKSLTSVTCDFSGAICEHPQWFSG